MLNYIGTPITPRSLYSTMCESHYCVSYFDGRDRDVALRHGASVMLDNGAFSSYTLGKAIDWSDFYKWAEPAMYGANWAVVPDQIGGTSEDNRKLEKSWPFPRRLSATVYHFGEPLDRLRELLDGWPRIAIGGSVGSFPPGGDAWIRQIDMIWDVISQTNTHPWVHMMRAMSTVTGTLGRWPFASADSTSFARNHHQFDLEGKVNWLHKIKKQQPIVSANPNLGELF
jgi:hypothetical protein